MYVTPEAAAGILTLVSGFLAALGALIVKLRGTPEQLMAHEIQLTGQQHQHAEALEKIEAEAEAVPETSAIAAMERRLDALERAGREQATKIGLLSATNTRLVKRVGQLERQGEKDQATIADLRSQLSEAQAEIERLTAQCGACPHRVQVVATVAKVKAAKAKPASKKRRTRDA